MLKALLGLTYPSSSLKCGKLTEGWVMVGYFSIGYFTNTTLTRLAWISSTTTHWSFGTRWVLRDSEERIISLENMHNYDKYTLTFCVRPNLDGSDGTLRWFSIHGPLEPYYGVIMQPYERIYEKDFLTYNELFEFVSELLVSALIDTTNTFECQLWSIRNFLKRSWSHGYRVR